MADIEWVDNLAKLSLKAYESGKPLGIYYGTVLKNSPIQIQTEQKLTLSQAQLILTRNVKNHSLDMQIEGLGSTRVLVENRLAAGEKVILLREQGGQRYLVLDRC